MIFLRHLLCCLVLALFVVGCTRGDDRAPQEEPVSEERMPPVVNSRSPDQSAGIFVGIETFPYVEGARRPREVAYAVNDAIDLAYALSIEHGLLPVRRVHLLLSGKAVGGSIRRREEMLNADALIGSATKEAIESALKEEAGRVGPGGILFIYFATHGYSDGERQFLMAADSGLGSGYDMITAEGILQATQAESGGPRLLILDTCRLRVAPSLTGGSSSAPGSRSAIPQSRLEAVLMKTLTSRPGYAVIFATGPDGIALGDPERRNGFLTGALLDGLRCESASAEPRTLTLAGLSSFVQKAVARRSKGLQSAQWLTAEGFEDFPLVRCGPIGEILEPREGQSDPPDVVRARIHQDGYHATAVIYVESIRVYFNQQPYSTFRAKPGVDLRIPVHYGGAGRFQVYLGLSADPGFLVGEDQLESLPAQDDQGRPVHWFGPVNVVLPEENP